MILPKAMLSTRVVHKLLSLKTVALPCLHLEAPYFVYTRRRFACCEAGRCKTTAAFRFWLMVIFGSNFSGVVSNLAQKPCSKVTCATCFVCWPFAKKPPISFVAVATFA